MENRAKPRRANEAGPVGRRAARNLEQLRDSRHLSQGELAEIAECLGRPMTRQIVSKTEAGDRRIDVDDLVALTIALDTTPNRLLLPGTVADDVAAELTPKLTVSALDAWLWATGEEPLSLALPDRQILVRDDRERHFVRENQPHNLPGPYFRKAGRDLAEHPELARQAAALAQAAHEHGVQFDALIRLIENAELHRRFGRLLERHPAGGLSHGDL